MTNLTYIEDPAVRGVLHFLLDYREPSLQAQTYCLFNENHIVIGRFDYKNYHKLPAVIRNDNKFLMLENGLHLDWLMDQILHIMMQNDDKYAQWVKAYEEYDPGDGEDYPLYEWSTGESLAESDSDVYSYYVEESENTSPDHSSNLQSFIDAVNYSWGYDGAHHKRWALDNIVRAITGKYYKRFVDDYQYDENLNKRYTWDVGIPA